MAVGTSRSGLRESLELAYGGVVRKFTQEQSRGRGIFHPSAIQDKFEMDTGHGSGMAIDSFSKRVEGGGVRV